MATNHGRACFSTRRPHAPGAYATGMAAIRRCAAVQSDNRNNRLSACTNTPITRCLETQILARWYNHRANHIKRPPVLALAACNRWGTPRIAAMKRCGQDGAGASAAKRLATRRSPSPPTASASPTGCVRLLSFFPTYESLHGMFVTFVRAGRTLQTCHGRIHP